MPLVDITKPHVIKFLNEAYTREDSLRLRWNERNKEKIRFAAQFRGEEKGYTEVDVTRKVVISGFEALTEDHQSYQCNKRKKPMRDGPYLSTKDLKKDHTIVSTGLGSTDEDPRLDKPDSDTSLDPLMRPVPKEQTKIIYGGRPDFGREKYLKVRNKIIPEKRFYFPETSYWETGWRLRDSKFWKLAPKHPKQGALFKALKNRVGATPNPSYYGDSKVLTQSKLESLQIV